MSDDLNKLKYSNSLNCKLSNPNNVGKLKKPDTSNNNVIRDHIQHDVFPIHIYNYSRIHFEIPTPCKHFTNNK